GREYLLARVLFFTSRNLPLEMCLPAFPCKSSNPEKVTGTMPDRGEELALRRLHQVLRQIKEVYPPGAFICIISDGHVFSDCIGVDDDTVDEYGARLIALNNAIIQQNRDLVPAVRFQSLKDIFFLDPTDALARELALPEVDHFIATRLCEDSEFCRQVLQLSCQPDSNAVRDQIVAQDAAMLALYRGFSRFMLEDLALHPLAQPLSRKQKKKLAEKVSFEMMLRNQAYSNLVELVFPDHIRLSIHAHVNTGPKFGITLFDRAVTRVVDSLDLTADSLRSPETHDLLHIPTPWHNCVAQLADATTTTTFIASSKVVQDAVLSGNLHGHWVEGDVSKGLGRYFEI
ncbi:hypothetical protein ASPZODRAFT_40116, partial [Penicilliopsis zonata CBS 506.65]